MPNSNNKPNARRFNLRGLIILTTSVACILGLSSWVHAGLYSAIPLTVVPFALVVERVFGGTPVTDAPPSIEACIFRWLILVSVALMMAIPAWISVSGEAPNLLSPFPFLVLVPIVYQVPLSVTLAIPVSVFLVLNFYHGRSSLPQPIPLRFPTVLSVATACSLWWFVDFWLSGMKYHGGLHTWGVTIINAFFIILLWSLWGMLPRSATKYSALSFSMLLCCWLFWFAFPCLVDFSNLK